MNIIDSSAWIEYFNDGANASEFAGAIEDPATLVVPSWTIYEVYRRMASPNEKLAARAVDLMLQGRVVDLTATLAINAAALSLETGLAAADSIILATARANDATLWTQDAHFEGLPGVEFRARK